MSSGFQRGPSLLKSDIHRVSELKVSLEIFILPLILLDQETDGEKLRDQAQVSSLQMLAEKPGMCNLKWFCVSVYGLHNKF